MIPASPAPGRTAPPASCPALSQFWVVALGIDWANAAGFSGPNVQLDLTLSTIYPCTTLSPYPAHVLPSKEGRLARAIQPLCRQIAEARRSAICRGVRVAGPGEDVDRTHRGLPPQPFQFGRCEGKRRVASFGFRYDDTIRRLEEADPIPSGLGRSLRRSKLSVAEAPGIGRVLCTEYDVGVGIGWHRDMSHFDRVFGLSLGSACKFRFRRPAYNKWERFTLEARPRSI